MTPSPFRLLGLLLLVFVAMTPLEPASGQGLEVDDRDIDQWARGRLAVSFDAISSELLSRPGILAPQLELAFGLALVATELDPESALAWRRLLEISTALERDVLNGEEIRRQAIEKLVRLEPDDDVMRLRLLLDRIEGRPTAQERVAAYQTLLEPENLIRLGREAGARIAYDLALLQQRIGDMNASALRIAQAVQLDPSFPQAADMAAGLFRSVAPTPIDEAELLAIAFTASPGDAVIARSLADLVLASGAYVPADDLFNLVGLLFPSTSTVQDILTADRMLACWGDRRNQDARDLAERSIRSRRNRVKQQLIREGFDPSEVEQLKVPPAPGISLVLAVIESRDGDRIQRDAAVATLFDSYRFDLDEIERRTRLIEDDTEIDDEQRSTMLESVAKLQAEVFADQAWARAWFGWAPASSAGTDDIDDGEQTRLTLDDLLKGAIRGDAIDEEQEKVIRGWAAMEREDFEGARVLLAPATESSPYAEAGIALLDEAEGSTKEAARRYLDVYNARPGTLVGLWCRSRLEAILDTQVPVTDQGELMGDMLKATLPDAVGRVVQDPRHGVLSMTVEPRSLRTTAFEPMILDIKVTNVSSLKLAIGPDSPIGATLAIVPDVVDIVNLPPVPAIDRQSQPVVVALNRNFALDPQETVEVSLDLTSTRLAHDFAMGSVFGGSFKMRAVVNYVVTSSGNIDAGQFGREGVSPVFRIDGLDPLQGDRLQGIIEEMRGARTVSDAKDIAAMLQLVLPSPRGEAMLSEDSIYFATVDACLALPPTARAWVMSLVLPGSQRTIRLVDRLVADGTRPSMAVALSRFSGTPTSNAIVVGLESDDPLIRKMAEAAKELATMFEIQRDKQMLDFEAGGDDDEDDDQ